jgi:hypothetical protein
MPRPTSVSLTSTAALVGGLALAAGALAACSGSSGSSSGGSGSASSMSSVPSSPAPSTATTTVTTGEPATTPSSPGSSSVAAGGAGHTNVTDCAESQLKAELDPRPVKGSTTHTDLAVIVDFTNTSNSTCVLEGYPGAALENDKNQQVKQATRTVRGNLLGLPPSQNSLPRVTLAPGDVASAGIEGVNQQEAGAAQAGCDDSYYPRILVTPPNTRTAVPFTYKWPVCFSFTVHPTNIEKNPPTN